MEVKCIKFKFENTTYIIKDLEIDSRSLNTKSIVAKLFTKLAKFCSLDKCPVGSLYLTGFPLQ